MEIVAVVDRTAERRALASSLSPGIETFAEFAALDTVEDIDFVDICTPPSLHLDIASEAAAAGKHVYCEKPVGRDLDETTAIWEAVRRAWLEVLASVPRRAP